MGVVILRRNEEGNAVSDLRSRDTHSLGGQGYRSTKQNHQKCHVFFLATPLSLFLSLSPFLPPPSSRVSVLVSLMPTSAIGAHLCVPFTFCLFVCLLLAFCMFTSYIKIKLSTLSRPMACWAFASVSGMGSGGTSAGGLDP